jgi:hypothetical protein
VRLFYRDLTIEVARAKDGDAADSRHFDAVFRWDDGKLVKVGRASSDRHPNRGLYRAGAVACRGLPWPA